MVITIKDIPSDVNYEMTKGDDWSKKFTVKVDDIAEDITGSTFYFTIKEDPTDPDSAAAYQEVITSLADPTNGVFYATIPNSVTSTFDIISYKYDISWKSSAGVVKTLIYGNFTVIQDVTLDD